MITLRNPEQCNSLTVVAKEDLEVGQVVKIVQGDALGEVPGVAKIAAADLTDAGTRKGIVYFVQDNDLRVEFIINPATGGLTLNNGEDGAVKIPAGSLCTIWFDGPIIGYHQTLVAPGFDISAVREGSKIGVAAASARPAAFNAAGEDGTQVDVGYVYRNEGAELTIAFDKL